MRVCVVHRVNMIYNKCLLNTLSNEFDNTASFLDLLFSEGRNITSADNDRLADSTLGQNLGITLLLLTWVYVYLIWLYKSYMLKSINDRNLFSVLVLFTNTFTSKSPDFVKVDDRTPERVLLQVEVTHTDLTKVTRVVLVHVGTVMVLTTSKTTTTRMLSVLANTTVTGWDVSTLLSVMVKSGRL